MEKSSSTKNSLKQQFLDGRIKKDLVHMAENLGISHAKSHSREKLLKKINRFSYRKLVIALKT